MTEKKTGYRHDDGRFWPSNEFCQILVWVHDLEHVFFDGRHLLTNQQRRNFNRRINGSKDTASQRDFHDFHRTTREACVQLFDLPS